MSIASIRQKSISVECPVDYEMYRFVTVDFSAGTCVYTSAGAKPNAVTITKANTRSGGIYTIEVVPLNWINGTHHLDCNGAIAAGNRIEVGTNGMAKVLTGVDTLERWVWTISTDLIAANAIDLTIDGNSITQTVFATTSKALLEAVIVKMLAKAEFDLHSCNILAGSGDHAIEWVSHITQNTVTFAVSGGVSQPNHTTVNFPERLNARDTGFVCHLGAADLEVCSASIF